MSCPQLPNSSLLVIAIVLLAMAAVLDLAFRKIPNWLPLALTADGLVLRVLSGELLAGIAAGDGGVRALRPAMAARFAGRR